MVSQGCKAAVLEISSHGLALDRVAEIAFDAAMFTNLTPDHLDFHPTFEEYKEVKRSLFRRLDQSSKKNKRAFFNGDSPWTGFMQEGMKTPFWTFGIDQPADVRASRIASGAKGTSFEVSAFGKEARFDTSLIGRYNVYNLLGAIALGLSLGAELEPLADAVRTFQQVPGRLERAGESVFVDYAHSGESLANVLKTLKELSPKRLIVVFGCGGNRDPARRTGMAQAAERYADLAIVTSDNSREEDPQEICRQILSGFTSPEKVYVELDRKAAIFHAVQTARPEDIVLIAGKGHERMQIFSHQTLPFDDVAVAREALQRVS